MKLKLVTLNIRITNPVDFETRAHDIADKIHTEFPDIICFQELSTQMKAVLAPLVPEYTFIGGGRYFNRLGEGTPIAFKSDRFVISEFRTRWLSATPYIPESRYIGDQGGCPRVYTYSLLTECSSGESLRVYDTHFDKEGKNARLMEADVMLETIKDDTVRFQYPAVLVGDLNATPEKPEIRKIAECGFLTDITSHFEQTFNYFDEPFDYENEHKIDYIFITDAISCIDTKLWDYTPDGRYLSDHFGIMATLEITAKK